MAAPYRRSASRPLRLVALLLGLVLGLLVLPGLSPSWLPAARADGSSTTVAGTWFPWNPLATNNGDGTYTGAYDTSYAPTVTVDQTQNLVDQVVHVSWSHFTPSSDDITYSGPPHASVNAISVQLYPVEVLECTSTIPSTNPIGTDATKWQDCYPAETISVGGGAGADGGHGQNNAILAVTRPDGTGGVDFHVENRPTNDLLGCDATHACSIVVVPNNGGAQPTGGAASCDDHSQDVVGPPNYDQQGYAGVGFRGGACSWADRIVVPLHFAPLPSDCPIHANSFTAVGSPMVARGFNQLLAAWCQGRSPLNFGYNSTTDEYQARSLFGAAAGGLTAATDVALVTQPADPATVGSRRFTYAPIANNAIAIPYYVDNAKTGLPITDLQLTARLVAKLLTQSYVPARFNCSAATDPTVEGPYCNPNDAGNPASIFDDPEFQQLNFRGDHPSRDYFPSNVLNGNQDSLGAFFPTVLAGNSDLTYELTRWVESDPDARAFLAGHTDPWGMHVNRAYLQRNGAQLYPTSQLQPLDPGWTHTSKDPYLFTEGFQSTWNPISGLPNVATTLVGGLATAQVPYSGKCSVDQPADACQKNAGLPVNFSRAPGEVAGVRNLWAITDTADAAAFQFPTAALVNAAGNAETPDVRGMSDALAHMKTNPDKITQYVDHSSEAADGYPLTEVVYAMVPTCGLTPAKSAAISSMLTHVADSQNYGVQPGTLAPGLLGLTAAQLAQTRAAAQQVSSQSCTSPPPDNTIGGHKNPHTGTPGSPVTGAPSGNGGSGAPVTGGTSPTPSTGATGPSSHSPSTSTGTSSPAPAKNVGMKPAGQNESMAFVLPMMLILGLVFLVAAPLTWLLTATAAGRAAARRLRFW